MPDPGQPTDGRSADNQSLPLLTLGQLNRATLARQLLLGRESIAPVAAVERLAGMQAQEPAPPFVGLWSRVAGFRREQLLTAIHAHEIVRGTMMRGTIHLVSADDHVAFRRVLQPLLDRGMRLPEARTAGPFAERLARLTHELLAAEPRPIGALREPLAAAFPDFDGADLAQVGRLLVPLLMVPEEHPVGFPGNARFTPSERLLGRPVADGGDGPGELFRRCLAAFGPATVADVAKWSGLGAVRRTLDAMPDLVRFRDEQGRVLYDLPEAPRPAADVPAPARFLPRFDNLLLAHADPARCIGPTDRKRVFTVNGIIHATFLWDGVVAGRWAVEREGETAVLRLAPFRPLPAAAIGALAEEGAGLARFVDEDAGDADVRVDEPSA